MLQKGFSLVEILVVIAVIGIIAAIAVPYIGSILVSVNPYRMFDVYGLDTVSKYEGQLIGTLPPHLFAVGASAYHRLVAKPGENQVIN